MTYEPPSASVLPAAAPLHPPVPRRPSQASAQPLRLSGMTSDGSTVKVRPWRPANAVVAVAAQVMLSLTALVNLAVAGLDVQVKGMIADGDFEAAIDRAASAEGLASIATLLVLPTVVLFLVWVHRLWTSDRSAHNVYTRSTGLAVGGWLVPVANLVLGPNALRDLWHGTERARRGIHDGPVDRRTPGLVTAWWVFVLLTVVMALVARAVRVGADGATSLSTLVSALQAGLGVEAVGSVLSAVSATLLVLVIRRITAFTRR